MTGLVLAILCGLNFLLFPCEGQVVLSPGGDTFYGLQGNNVTIAWKINVSLSSVAFRSWTFLPNSNSFADISGANGNVQEKHLNSPGPFTIIKPSTLNLNNVTIEYDGKYRFLVVASGQPYTSVVTVVFAEKPNVTINCSDSTRVNEGNSLTCVGTEQGGNPPANLTWYKDGKQMGNTSYGENTLNLTNVNKNDDGIYTCKAQSYTLKDEKSIEVKVRLNFKPNNTTLTPNTAAVGASVRIICKSEGLPEPTYIITRNGIVVSRNNTYTISEIMESDNGTCAYECIASNKLGNDSACSNITIEPRPPPTSPTTTRPPTTTSGKTPSPSGNSTATKKQNSPDPCPVWCILIIVIVVVVVLVIIAYVVYRYKKKEKEGYRSSCFSGNPEVSPDGSGGVNVNQYELDGELAGGVDNTYDTANPSRASASKSKPPKNTLPPVYAAVDKSKKDGKPLYATLDTVALHSDNSKKKRDEERPGQSEYASIDFGKIGKADEE